MAEGDVEGAAKLLGRPVEVEGIVVAGDARGGTLGFPTANLGIRPELLVPTNGIYAGAAGDHRAAVSIGTNPHYGGRERRVEAHLLDFKGDLYGRRLVVELWQRLRDEAAFDSEQELIAQIGRDVEATRRAESPV
jgi:riboflavin kinase/FMN adenylyltransferase